MFVETTSLLENYQRPRRGGRSLQELNPFKDLPKSLDWKAKGMVSDVKTQGSCNSCYAFSSNAAFEAHMKIKGQDQLILSE